MAPTKDAASVTFARTDLLGVYTVTGIADPGATPATPTPTPGPSASAGASTSAAVGSAAAGSPGALPTFRPADPGAPARFAVDLLDVDESNIAPGDVAKLTALGHVAASPGPGASGAPAGAAGAPAERPKARDELWIPIVLIALLVLTLEWLVYERDTLARLRRALAARIHRAPHQGRGA